MIRPYSIADKEQLIALFKLNVPAYFDASELPEFLGYLETMSNTYLIIEHATEVIGGLGYEVRESDESGRINWIFLHPTVFGGGHGKKAVHHCLEILRADARVKKLIVRTSQLVYPFFEKLGYQVVQTQKDYWAPGLDLYLMEQAI